MNKSLLEFWAVITADRKKAAMLGTLVVVAGGLWVRASLMTGPDTAKAGTDAVITTLSTASPGNAAAAESDEPDLRRTIALTSPPPLTRDLFALSDVFVSLSSQTDPAAGGSPKSASGTDDKPLRPIALGPAAIEQRVREEAAGLRLRSTMIGASPIAVIETPGVGRHGAVVRVGDEVEGFRVISIGTEDVELEKAGTRVTLTRSTQKH